MVDKLIFPILFIISFTLIIKSFLTLKSKVNTKNDFILMITFFGFIMSLMILLTLKVTLSIF